MSVIKTLIYRTSPPTFCKFVSGHNNFDISFHLPPRRAARRHLARHRRTPLPQIKIKARNVPCCDCGDMEATEAANVVDEDEDGIGDEDEDDAAMATQARHRMSNAITPFVAAAGVMIYNNIFPPPLAM